MERPHKSALEYVCFYLSKYRYTTGKESLWKRILQALPAIYINLVPILSQTPAHPPPHPHPGHPNGGGGAEAPGPGLLLRLLNLPAHQGTIRGAEDGRTGGLLPGIYIINDTQKPEKKDKGRIKGKGRRCFLGDRINSIPLPRQLFCTRMILKNRMNSSYSLYHPGAIHSFLPIIRVQNSQRGKELNEFFPPNNSDDLYLFLSLSYFSTSVLKTIPLSLGTF